MVFCPGDGIWNKTEMERKLRVVKKDGPGGWDRIKPIHEDGGI